MNKCQRAKVCCELPAIAWCAYQQVRGKVEANAVPLAKYIIRKQLTKRPEDYPDAASQPHVQACSPTHHHLHAFSVCRVLFSLLTWLDSDP